MTGGLWITAAVVEAHKVRSGEALGGLAAEAGLSWQELAQFNWQTAVPREIHQRLRQWVGCSKKTKDGKNYVFDDSDEPGIVFVPRRWKASGLPLNARHTVRLMRQHALVLHLEDSDGHPIPEAEYEVTFDDGSKRQGRLGRGGASLIVDPPPGPFAVRYPGHHDILAKSLAAAMREAVAAADMATIIRFLQHPPAILSAAQDAYASYHDDYTGEGLVEDIYAAVTDDKALAGVEGLMAYGGLAVRGAISIAQRMEVGG